MKRLVFPFAYAQGDTTVPFHLANMAESNASNVLLIPFRRKAHPQ
jgi:hypothetical protein